MKPNIQDFPLSAGIYLFKDPQNIILYIGKAKSLRKRVQSYFRNPGTDWKVDALIQEHSSIEYIGTKNETEALLLEAQLIKEHKPKYNVLLKTGNPFLYILFTQGPTPEINLVRHKKEKGKYFGPFLHKQQTRSAHRYLVHTFQLALCNKKIDNGCLDYHLGICAGSCMPTFDRAEYRFRLQLAQNALESNHRAFLKQIYAQIAYYNSILAFEKSKHLHEYINNLDTIFATVRTKFSRAKYDDAIFAVIAPRKHVSTLAQTAGPDLQQMLGIEKPVETIDCFDISHFQSKNLVGSCIRFKNGIPDKNNFRRFKIKTLQEQNDYAALQEIVMRRYRDQTNLPDLILIDGGKGQRNAIVSLVPTTPCISLAKKEEILHSDRFPEGQQLDISAPAGQLLIALRDYAHHFAISYHKKRRSLDFESEKESAPEKKLVVKIKNDVIVIDKN